MVDRDSRVVANRTKVLTPVDTGLMRAEQHRRVIVRGSQVVGTITFLVPYIVPVHDGWQRTAPILPVKGKALKFKLHGRTVIVSRVNTPASYGGRPFAYRALYEVCVPRGYKVVRFPS